MCSAIDVRAGVLGATDADVRAGAGHVAATTARRLLAEHQGQATVEAAFALPVLLVLVLLLLQPGIVLYDRVVMHGAAAEGCRLLASSSSADAQVNDDYLRRRLGAIPELDLFHVHSSGCTWDIQLEGGEGSDIVSVKLATELKPLPLIDCAMTTFGMTNESGNFLVKVESTQHVQPDWVNGAVEGRAPAGWVGI